MIDADRPHDLRADHLTDPVGIGPVTPRLSWKLPAGATSQRAYRIVAGDWDSGRVESADSLFMPIEVSSASGLAVEWKVRVWTDLGESDWSHTASWEHGLLHPSDWVARWIAPIEGDDLPARQRPAYQLAGAVRIDGEIASARLYATAHGLYEAFINGNRVGDQELTPGWTAYRTNLQVQTYDVTDLLTTEGNVVGALLSDGWWRGQNSVSRRVDDYGTTTALLMQLAVTLVSGDVLTLGTDASWRCAPSHILRADLVAGEVHDLSRRTDWSSEGEPVRVEDHGYAELCASPAPPVRRVEELTPASVHELAAGRWVVDLGQNISGWIRVANLGPAGTALTLTYGEWLDADGDVTQDHVAYPASAEVVRSVTFQVDQVTSAGVDGEVFEPRHSSKGFQYVRIEGHPGPLTGDDVTGVVVHTDFEHRGAFECSDDRINALHRIAEWSFRDNACDIPTDCPTRERAGWTGDWQIFVETAAFLSDVGGFSVKWLRDLAADQRTDGKVTNLVPESHPGDDRPPAHWPRIEGSSGWGDAAVHVPWTIYRTTGDRQVLVDQWGSAKAWVDYAANAAATRRHPSRLKRSAEPAPYERYLWDTGWHFGEWLEAGEALDDAIGNAMVADHGPVATAYLHRSAQQLSAIAAVLGRDDEARRYAELATNVGDAWRTEFLASDGTITPDTQATYARALAFGLIPDEQRAASANRLVELVCEAGTHISTGFLATPFVLPVLADTDHLDVAYDLLFQDTEPSWLVMVDRGASSIWEEWGGVDADGTPHASLNHYSKGAVITFLHQHTAGLQLLEPGYRRFRVAPQPGGGITWAVASHRSPYGPIEVRWEQHPDRFDLQLTVPSGTTADVELPSGRTATLTTGRHSMSS
ncbi:MAG: glycoside hydrolase family 78 protein [Actinomycetota bacterium]|nr:glycoside hydrolase family 78 protein [Actinomycetota bacterium]